MSNRVWTSGITRKLGHNCQEPPSRCHYLLCITHKRTMLTTCVTVSVIFVMLMYEISYSLKETLNDGVGEMSLEDPTSYHSSSIRDWGPVSYAGSELETM
ncbi:hypothetical protein Y032_0011g1322 [Ancylostoma ceylanicum]|uniref:Uncharacterized protein n=1 Tax=Ancylostoma ceylanicum TaxID=53326 RepID=A0A016VFZ4_9BILA|nr:hypothetical protein Y032_0011g1322 [Ancylostoma ceylanicum]